MNGRGRIWIDNRFLRARLRVSKVDFIFIIIVVVLIIVICFVIATEPVSNSTSKNILISHL